MRIAVLGCGSIGRRHLRNLQAEGRHELLVYDPEPDVAVFLRNVPKLEPSSTLQAVWKCKPQAVLVTATPEAHLELALMAVRCQAHLFVEKPLSNRLEGLAELETLARSSALVTMVGCNMRFHPGPAAVKALLRSGAIGAVTAARIQTGSYLPDWRPSSNFRKSYTADPNRGGGVLLDCIHEIDLALWYFGPATVLAAAIVPAELLQIPVEGTAEILLHHASGVLSSINLSFMQRDYRRGCQIVGELGTIYWDFEQPWVEVRSGSGLERRQQLPAGWEVNTMYVDEMRHFLQCVELGVATECPLEQGVAALKIALRAREIAATVAPVHPT